MKLHRLTDSSASVLAERLARQHLLHIVFDKDKPRMVDFAAQHAGMMRAKCTTALFDLSGVVFLCADTTAQVHDIVTNQLRSIDSVREGMVIVSLTNSADEDSKMAVHGVVSNKQAQYFSALRTSAG